MSKPTPLSDYLPEAIRQAVHDLELIEKGKHPFATSIDMTSYVERKAADVCEVCLGGATLYRQGIKGEDIDKNFHLFDFKARVYAKPEVLDHIRMGSWVSAVSEWNWDIDGDTLDCLERHEPRHSYKIQLYLDPEEAKRAWLAAADWLEKNIKKEKLMFNIDP